MKLKEILTELDGVCFSPFMLNAITRTGTKQAKVELLCDLLEYCSGVDRLMPLIGDYRHIPTLIYALKGQMAILGDRTRFLRLPADWSKQGVYELQGRRARPTSCTCSRRSPTS